MQVLNSPNNLSESTMSSQTILTSLKVIPCKGTCRTRGHEDHIGGIPSFLNRQISPGMQDRLLLLLSRRKLGEFSFDKANNWSKWILKEGAPPMMARDRGSDR